MNSTMEVIKRIEIPKITKNFKHVASNYAIQMLTGTLAALLLYALYFIIVVRYLLSFPLNVGDAFGAASILSLVFVCFLMVFSRGKLKHRNVVFLFFNTNLNAHQLILGSYFPLYIFLQVLFFSTYSPVLVSYSMQGNDIAAYSLILFIFLTIVFVITLSTWVLSSSICQKFFQKEEDNFYIQSGLFLTLLWLPFFGIRKLTSTMGSQFILWICLVTITALSVWIMYKLSTGFLMNSFKSGQSNISSKETKSYSLPYKRPFIHVALDFLYYYRFGLLRELVFIFLVLIIVTFSFNLLFDRTTFLYIYSFILNVGVKETLIITPLYVGMHYREYKIAFYNVNDHALTFLLPRIGLALGINIGIYFAFILINHLTLGLGFTFSSSDFASILFVSLLSLWVGFQFVIHEGNKATALIGTLIFVGLLDFVIRNYINAETILTLSYAIMSIALFVVIQFFYVRKPIIK